METISNYLDNMFINLPQTPEVLRAKEDLMEMMEDKYNELLSEGKMQNEAIGIVISEFGNIQELIEELGIADVHENSVNENDVNKNDINENDDKEKFFSEEDFTKQEKRENDKCEKRHVSDLEADEYLFVVRQSASKIASGVFLCICSPISIILLAGMQSVTSVISDGVIAGVGVTVLLCMVACAVGLFISAGMKMDQFEYLKKECFVLNAAYEQKIYYVWESKKRKFTSKIIAGVMLCIVSVIPLIFVSLITENEFPVIVCVALLMVTVGIAVCLFITAGMEEEAFKVILQEKEFSEKKKSAKKIEDIIAAIYWPVIVITYLVWSIVSGKWGITWVIWPFAGIIYDVICKIIDYDKIVQ